MICNDKLFANRFVLFVRLSTMVLLGVFLASCSSERNKANHLQITGSSTMAPLLTEMAKAFEQRHPHARIDVQTGGSSRGVVDTRTGLADIGMASRALKPQERDLKAHTIARDGIAIIVHRDNPITGLSRAQVQAIYRGEQRHWQHVGGKDTAINVVSKAEGRSTLELFLDYFELRSSDIKAHTIIGDNEQGIKTVAGNPNAIGYVSIGTAQYSVEQGVAIKLLATSGVIPSSEAVRNGTFPLSRPLNLVTVKEPQGLAAQFIAFARLATNEPLIEQQYFVPLAH